MSATRESHREPIAIVGIGCRFPGGASDPDALWALLTRGADATSEVPADRWDWRRFYHRDPRKPGKTSVKRGGYLRENIFAFDPLFFGISPREAETLDPQQRLLLETAWEAIEDAGIALETLQAARTGVFIGGFCTDNLTIRLDPSNRQIVDSHTAMAGTSTMLAARISHAFNLKGPCFTIDTACSSSLVAAHAACTSLWIGESDVAVAGGVNAMLDAAMDIVLSKGNFTSEHGYCKAFAADASGYSRAEGAGVLVLKRLSAAERDGDTIYAEILMTGINHDGQTQGVALPNAEAQKELVTTVLAGAGISPHQVQYVEAHGTGTQAGDGAEMSSLHEVFSQGRDPADKILVGSVKTNIGHLEAAAGVAGLIKTCLCLKHDKIPPNLHFERPNPRIPFDELCVRVPVHLEDWPDHDGRAIAAVNSFGYGGTNAHAVLRASAPTVRAQHPASSCWPRLIPISARSTAALQDLAAAYSRMICSARDATLDEIAYSATFRRSHLDYRIAAVAETKDELAEALETYAEHGFAPGVVVARNDHESQRDEQRLVFVYTGMGPQWHAMGRELLQIDAGVREAIEECDSLFLPLAGWSILEEMQRSEAESRMHQTQVAQPANFALQVALTRLWQRWGICPDAVVGHSVGEIAAAHSAGVLTLKDAIEVTYHRSRLQATTAGAGTMLAVGLPEDEAQDLIASRSRVSVAAINSAHAVTLAGHRETLEMLASELEQTGIFSRLLSVEVPYHSQYMDPIRDELIRSLREIEPRPEELPLYSTVTGDRQTGSEWGPEYWWRNVRQPVRFQAAVEALLRDRFSSFLEVGPHPVLKGAIRECMTTRGIKGMTLHSLHRKARDARTLVEALASFYVQGSSLDATRFAPAQGRYVKLPGYPFQREVYWRETTRSRRGRLGDPGHVFLDRNVEAPHPAWEVELSTTYFPFLDDHRLQDRVVFPGAAYLEAGMAVHGALFPASPCLLQEIEFSNLLVAEPDKHQELRTTFDPRTNTYEVFSRDINDDDSGWSTHAAGRVASEPIAGDRRLDLEQIRCDCFEEIDIRRFYAALEARGLSYGAAFRGIRHLWAGDDSVLARIEAPDQLGTEGWHLHPALVDAAFQSALALVERVAEDETQTYIPVSIERVAVSGQLGRSFYAYSRAAAGGKTGEGDRTARNNGSFTGDLLLLDHDGNVLVDLRGLRCLAFAEPGHRASPHASHYYDVTWQEEALAKGGREVPGAPWLVLAQNGSAADRVLSRLRELSLPHTAIVPGHEDRPNTGRVVAEEERLRRVLAEAGSSEKELRVVYLRALDANESAPLAETVVDRCWGLVQLIKAWGADRRGRIDIVTMGAQAVVPDDDLTGIESSPLWDLALVIENEHANLRCRLFDIDSLEPSSLDLLIYELLGDGEALDVALRAGKRWVKRVQRRDVETFVPPVRASTNDAAIRLRQAGPDRIVCEEIDVSRPGPDEVQIQVRTAAVVERSLNSAAERSSAPARGNGAAARELAGVVTGVGQSVTSCKVGDEVVAVDSSGALVSRALLDKRYVLPRMKGAPADATCGLLAYAAARHALLDVARLGSRERVLILDATEAPGLAAMQVARAQGAAVFATAGSEPSRQYLRGLGVEHVYDSRSIGYVDAIRSATDGRGVDVVLGSQVGEPLYQSLAVLAPHGRFVRLENGDLLRHSSLPLARLPKNATFATVDIEGLARERPAEVDRLLGQVADGLASGRYEPLPMLPVKAGSVTNADLQRSSGDLVGTRVIDFRDSEVDMVSRRSRASVARADGSYLVIGGTRGFGLEVAKWLAGQGAGQLVLVSRSGPRTKEERDAIASLSDTGVPARIEACDVTDFDAVCSLVRDIEATDNPLRGVVHSAMVYEDGPLQQLDRASLSSVLLPKVAGALNLHRATNGVDLDFFVMFSSISSLFGKLGQGAYVAANSFLDSMAYFRRARSLRATTINWGSLAESGIVARHREVEELLEKYGLLGMTNQEALAALDVILYANPVQIGFSAVNWDTVGVSMPRTARSSRFELVANRGPASAGNQRGKLVDALTQMDADAQEGHVAQLVLDALSRVLRVAPGKIEAHRPLGELGMDSMMVAELAIALQAVTGVQVTGVDIVGAQTPRRLTRRMRDRILVAEPAAAAG